MTENVENQDLILIIGVYREGGDFYDINVINAS